jgi:hypothetical protein
MNSSNSCNTMVPNLPRNRRPASWIKAEMGENTWNGEVLSIFPKPLSYASLAIGLEAQQRDPWYSGAHRVTSMLATFAVIAIGWALSAWSQNDNGNVGSAGSLLGVLMR